MQTLSANLVAFFGIAQSACDALVGAHFDILLFAVGLAGYLILHASRTRMNLSTFDDNGTKHGSESLPSNQGDPEERASNEQTSVVEMCERPSHESSLKMVTTDVNIAAIQRSIEDMQFYLNTKQFENACDLFALNFATFFDGEMGEDAEWRLMVAALRCGRLSIARQLFETSQMDNARSVLKIQRWWKRASQDANRNSRAQAVGEVFGRLSYMFNDRFPFEDEEDNSESESTVFLGDDDDLMSDGVDSDWDGDNWSF